MKGWVRAGAETERTDVSESGRDEGRETQPSVRSVSTSELEYVDQGEDEAWNSRDGGGRRSRRLDAKGSLGDT